MNKNIALEALLDNLSKAMSNKSWQSFKSSEFNKLNQWSIKLLRQLTKAILLNQIQKNYKLAI